jgi:hypothetical protein
MNKDQLDSWVEEAKQGKGPYRINDAPYGGPYCSKPEEYWAVVTYLAYTGKLILCNAKATKVEVKDFFDAKGEVTYPACGKKLYVHADSFAPIEFRYVHTRWVSGPTFGRPEGGKREVLGDPNPLTQPFIVFLYRFITALRDTFGITEFHYTGLGGGRDPTDRHCQGRAIDYYGCRVTVNETRVYNVYWDWGIKKVDKPKNVEKVEKDGKKKVLTYSNLWNLSTVSPQRVFRCGISPDAAGHFKKVLIFASYGDSSCDPDCDGCTGELREKHQTHIHIDTKL